MTWMVIPLMKKQVTFRYLEAILANAYANHPITESSIGKMSDYKVEYDEGMVVLDVIHRIQAEHAPDLACRCLELQGWKCGSSLCWKCGKSRLMCMTRMSDIMEETPEDEPVTVRPMQGFPLIRDLVTDVSWAYEMNKKMVPVNGPITNLIGVQPKRSG